MMGSATSFYETYKMFGGMQSQMPAMRYKTAGMKPRVCNHGYETTGMKPAM